jgi:ribosomal protein L7/L12
MDMLAHPWQLGAACFAAGFLLARLIYGRTSGTAAPPRTDISDAEVETELRAGRKVEAIKLCRQKYGYDLKTAVDEINALSARLGLRA